MAAPDPSARLLYRGRFAPSPTGPLHAGSVLTALASFLDARTNQGQWLLRIEDIDPPRESRQAADSILHTLDALGLHWDGAVLYQSQRHSAFEAALASLREQQRVFACACSRQQLTDHGGIYPGHCRDLQLPWEPGYALRCKVPLHPIEFSDRLQGHQAWHLGRTSGDFVVRRREGLPAYQLAVVVDDAFQQITDVVRGIDLLNSTPRQIWLQQLLGVPIPRYAHLPIVLNPQGQKLSKQQLATAVDAKHPGTVLVRALTQLQMHPEPTLAEATPAEILAWAIDHWHPETLAGIAAIPDTSAMANVTNGSSEILI